MHRIPKPTINGRHPDRVLAQTVAADSEWQQNDAGHVFDAQGTILANSLEDLARVMRALGWFVPSTQSTSGVAWGEIPTGEDSEQIRAAHVQDMAKRLGI